MLISKILAYFINEMCDHEAIMGGTGYVFSAIAGASVTFLGIGIAIIAVMCSRKEEGMFLRLVIKYDFAGNAIFSVLSPLLCLVAVHMFPMSSSLIVLMEAGTCIIMTIGIWRLINCIYYIGMEAEGSFLCRKQVKSLGLKRFEIPSKAFDTHSFKLRMYPKATNSLSSIKPYYSGTVDLDNRFG